MEFNGKVPFPRYDARDKPWNGRIHNKYMLSRLSTMFEYEGLPDTIPRREYELMLMTCGHVCITDVGGSLYAMSGGIGGPPNPYYMGTLYTVANPALNFSKMLKIGEECVLIRNDSLLLGVLPALDKFGCMLAENELTIRIADINCRIMALLKAGDERAKKAAEKYLESIIAGDLAVAMDNAFQENITTQPYATGSHAEDITDLIELEQYLKASEWNFFGLDANFNMKRESITPGEAEQNRAALSPYVDDMLRSRVECWNEVNKKYGTNVTVKLGGAWKEDDINGTQDIETGDAELEE